MDISNVAIVTGGTGSVGRELLPLLVRRNFKLGVTYLIPEEATELEAQLESGLEIDEDKVLEDKELTFG